MEQGLAPLIELVRRFEGCHKKRRDGLIYPYICPAGYATQGWGLLVLDMNAPPITQEEADRRMIAAVPAYVQMAVRLAPNLRKAPPEMLCAIADFVFNLGGGRFAGSTLRRRVREGNWPAAQRELQKWVFGGGKKLPGLVLRREAEAALIGQALR